ncbi:MAG: apolipoprotein N-acyltransferase [Candidatus Acidiferrum sp.]
MSRNWLRHFGPPPDADTSVTLRLVIAAVSGATLSFSYHGLYLTIYSWISVSLLLVVLLESGPLVAAGCGFLHGLFFCLTSLPWVAEVLARYGGVPRSGGWALLLLISATWGLLTAGFGWTVQRLSLRGVRVACLGAPFLWVSFEFLRAHLPEIGFPWNLLGYPAAANLGLVQLTTITGIYGLSFLAASFNALLAWVYADGSAIPRRRFTILASVCVILLLVMFAGPHLVPIAQANHTARAVQVNFPEDPGAGNWFETHAAELQESERLSLASADKSDLLIWPEAPAPFSFQDPRFAKVASKLAIATHHSFIAGVVELRQPPPDAGAASSSNVGSGFTAFNSALLLDAQGQRRFSYDKVHLVPFGEYQPFPLIQRVVSSVSKEVGGFQKGSGYNVGQLPGGYTFGTFICYEAIFPNEVRRFAENGAQLFVNISNDGWFGHSAAPEQHLHMARVRAVENRRWMIRVTNNGYTVSIDPYGRIVKGMPPDVRGATDLPYDFRTEKTIYTRLGDWFAWLCVVVSVILLATTFWKGNLTTSDTLPIPVKFTPSPVAAEPAAV